MDTRRSAGFTLIEVMIAVVILAVGMSALFTSQAGAVRIAQRARGTTVATLLARCKMGEVEEKVLKEGWPSTNIDGRDECCDGAEKDGFGCEWKVERITLPELDTDSNAVEAMMGGNSGGTTAGGSAAGGSEKGALPSPTAMPGGAAGGLAGMGGGDGGILEGMMSSQGSGGSEGSDPLAQMAMELTFPVIKPVIEESVRRATVTVTWKEGDAERTFDVVQFLVNELPMLPTEEQTEQLQGGATAITGGTTAGTAPGATPGVGGTTGGGTGGTVR